MKGYLCLGSNLGDRLCNIQSALKDLELAGIKILKVSSVYETKPHGVDAPQENYYNLVAAIEYDKTPQELLGACRKTEDLLGRHRPYRHAPRTIDIDILMLGTLRISSLELTVPHPRVEVRPFVVYPLAEIAPDIALPSGRGVLEVKNALPDDEIVRAWKLSDG